MKRVCMLMALLIASPAFAQQAEKTTVYTHANLFDGTGSTVKPDMTVITQGERIVAVGNEKIIHFTLRDAARIAFGDHYKPTNGDRYKQTEPADVDLHGQYVIPGLVNSHVHMATQPNRRFAEALLRRDVYSGVTAVRDMAGDARALADLSRSARLGDIPSPDIYYSALMAGPQFFKDPRTHAAAQGVTAGDVPWLQAITDKTDLKLAVAEARGTGATGIKIYADLPGTLVRAITAEAHRQNILVWSHAAVFPATPADAIDGGVDVVSHVCMLAYQASHAMPPEYHNRAPVEADKFTGDNAVVGRLFADMKARGTILDATLWVYEEMAKEHATEPKSPAPYCSADLAAKLLNRAYRAGVMISAGTDGFTPWQEPYVALDDEVALLVSKAGMSPADAIRSATFVGAKTVGKANEMGTLEPGKLANFVVLAKSPLDDVANLKTVTLTVKRGVRFRRADYRPITADEAQGDL